MGSYITTDKELFLPCTIGEELLFCSGAPLRKEDDSIFGSIVKSSKALRVVMGGTTAKIVARELGEEITVDLRRDPSGLPPTSVVNGIERVSEGVLTLMAVKNFLKTFEGGCITGDGIKFDIARLLLSHRRIFVLEGTQVNKEHFDLPIKLERRSDLINEICELLEQRFDKEIKRVKI